MPRELIRKLSEDVGQLLVAGAHLAPSSIDLQQDREGLDRLAKQLGGKAPAIGKLAEACGKTTLASADAVAGELMNLAQMAAQVRAAQAQVAPAAESSVPLDPCEPIGTPCNAKDLDALYAALVEKGQGRLEVVERAIEAGTIADLRLVEALVFAMGDSWVGETITDKAIPKLGRAIVAPIRTRLQIKKGRTIDGRRLRALVAIEKAGAKELLAQAVSEGSAEIREAAMDAIADHVQGLPEFEQHALEAIRKEKSADIRRAAVRALSGSSSNDAIELLLEAVDKANTTEAAAQALAASNHPQAAPRILSKLQQTVAAAKKKAKSKGDDKDKDAEPRLEIVRAVLGALSHHRAPAIADAAIELIDEYGAAAAWAVVGSGDRKQLERVASTIEGSDADLYAVAVAAAFALGEAEAFKRLSPLFRVSRMTALLGRKKKASQQQLGAVVDCLRKKPVLLSEQWRTLLVEVVDKEPAEVAAPVVPLLGEAREQRAVAPLIRIVDEGKGDIVSAAIMALGQIGDRAALDPILARLSEKNALGWVIRNAVLNLADPASVDKVRSIFVALKNPQDYSNWPIRTLLQALESRFPGY
jgi:hypothetical protein